MHIQDLMKVAERDRDLHWLKQSLGSAIELELATLPPYLTALWSIKAGWGPAMAQIVAVVKEEMLHMVLAGNMLRSIGGRVKLVGPSYPGHLPGNVLPGLLVPLVKLSKQSLLDVFMAIEQPVQGPQVIFGGEYYTSIGGFYDAILACFETLQPEQTSEGQLSGVVGGHAFGPVDTLDKVRFAITEIKEQGEGTPHSPLTDPKFGTELSHYYRFAEVYHGRKLIKVEGEWRYAGEAIPMPPVFDMAPVPKGGYPNGPAELTAFNEAYGKALDDLEAAWAETDANKARALFGYAVEAMYGLQRPAQALMQMRIPHFEGNYGPDWRPIRSNN